jgi:hypothetical protein
VNEQQAPVFWDGGYWYVVEADVSRPGFRTIPDWVPSPDLRTAHGGTVNGVDYMFVRIPTLWLSAPPVPVTLEQVIEAAKAEGHAADVPGKPLGMRTAVETQ